MANKVEAVEPAESGLYPLVEDFYSLQGEGFHSGMPAYFIRLAGCPVRCDFCDSKNTWSAAGFPRVSARALADRAARSGAPAAVVTGGEPLMHDLDSLCEALHAAGLACWLETSGSQPLSGRWDWICVSPKHGAPLQAAFSRAANEMKVVVAAEADFAFAETCARFFEAGRVLQFLQCEWGQAGAMQRAVIDYILRHPQWRLSLQTHKFLNIR